jgi:hypothetical protein
MFRRALCSTGSLGWVPPLPRSIDALRLPAAPLSLRLRSRFAVPSSTEQTGSPKFLGSPRHTRHGSSTPVESREQDLRDMRPYVSLRRCCLPILLRRRLPRLGRFGARFRGSCARCLRFVTRVALGRHARLASGWRPCLGRAGVEPAGLRYKVSIMCGLHGVLLVEAFLAHRRRPKGCATMKERATARRPNSSYRPQGHRASTLETRSELAPPQPMTASASAPDDHGLLTIVRVAHHRGRTGTEGHPFGRQRRLRSAVRFVARPSLRLR